MTSGDTVQAAAEANHTLGRAYQFQGDFRRALDCFKQAVETLEGVRRHERFDRAFLPAVQSRAWPAWCHAELGTFAEGRVLGEEGLRIAEAVAHPVTQMLAWWGIGLPALLQGDLPRALPLLERVMGMCQDTGLTAWSPLIAEPSLGAAYTLGGRVADALPLLTQALEQLMSMERVDFQARCHLSLGEAHMLAGHLEEAHTLTDRALAHAREHQERGNQAYALRLLGEIATRREPPEIALAETHYRQALALATELSMHPLQAHCRRGLGTLYRQIGQAEYARAELSRAIEMYRDMEMTFWLPETEAALAAVEGR